MKIKSKKLVIQKYIEDPLLFEGKKFDIRLYIMVNQHCSLFMFRDMYVRVSAYPFSLSDKQKFGHLNNIALQKYSKHYDSEKAVININQLSEYIRDHYYPTFDFETLIRPKLQQIISILGAVALPKFKVFHPSKKHFEIFGLDFMIDRSLKVWLIEANTNPAITTGNGFLDSLIPRMLDDAFKITLDKLFPKPKKNSPFLKQMGKEWYEEMEKTYHQTVFPLEGYSDGQNLWRKITQTQIENSLLSHPN